LSINRKISLNQNSTSKKEENLNPSS